ncbi:hypothetical protein HYU92_01595 [Candidatus Curtissbacteria bacterium]|nr:hypothetical protein [Candidatus Curtissbacteria bacterium]
MTTILVLAWLLMAIISPVYAAPSDPAKLSDIIGILQNIIGLLTPAAAVAFFIMVLVGGFQFVTSGGDPKAAAAARNTLTFAAIGIILVISVWLILQLVGFLTGVPVTNVTFPSGP